MCAVARYLCRPRGQHRTLCYTAYLVPGVNDVPLLSYVLSTCSMPGIDKDALGPATGTSLWWLRSLEQVSALGAFPPWRGRFGHLHLSFPSGIHGTLLSGVS